MTGADELTAAVLDRLKRCSQAEAMIVLGQIVGFRLAQVPAARRQTVRGIFLEIVDRQAADPIGTTVGSA